LSRFLQLALARQSVAKESRYPFWIYLDEAEHFVTPSVASLVTEARKYGVGMMLAFQTQHSISLLSADSASMESYLQR
jgi:type IV secretory pathway TraG/TraD family ATPase VirD4